MAIGHQHLHAPVRLEESLVFNMGCELRGSPEPTAASICALEAVVWFGLIWFGARWAGGEGGFIAPRRASSYALTVSGEPAPAAQSQYPRVKKLRGASSKTRGLIPSTAIPTPSQSKSGNATPALQAVNGGLAMLVDGIHDACGTVRATRLVHVARPPLIHR